MLQDIEPRVFRNAFQNRPADPQDLFLAFQDDNVLIRQDKDKLWYPSFADFSLSHPQLRQKARFLFAIDDLNYYLVEAEGLEAEPGWVYVSNKRFRSNNWRSFIGIIGWQLHSWYNNHKFCSRCREPLQHSEIERLLYCANCGMSVYPTIAPCVIVGVYDKDRLLLTKYANREYRKYALIAGFNEIGESLEQTVRREVMEEVGLQVKNIRYYKSQPWPFSDTLLAGFFAELDGADTIRLDEDELAVGVWLSRKDIPEWHDNISLTGEMIEAFRRATINLEETTQG